MDVPMATTVSGSTARREKSGTHAHNIDLSYDTTFDGNPNNVVPRDLRAEQQMEMEDQLDASSFAECLELLHLQVDTARVILEREIGRVLIKVPGGGWVEGKFFGVPTASQRGRNPNLTHRVKYCDGTVAMKLCNDNRVISVVSITDDQTWAFVTDDM